MEVAALSAAFAIGLAGSLHCVVMCGPLAMAVPQKGNRILAVTAYNLSRITMYGLLGFLFGTFGAQITFLESGQRLSLILGAIIFLFFVLPYFIKGIRFNGNWNAAAVRWYSKIAGPVLRYRGPGSMFFFGAINGLLPCGLIYAALSGAVATGSPEEGAIFMITVGLGTWPAMLGMMAFRSRVGPLVRKYSSMALPIVAGFIAMALITRGLNLNIPYLSPKIEKVGASAEEVCD